MLLLNVSVLLHCWLFRLLISVKSVVDLNSKALKLLRNAWLVINENPRPTPDGALGLQLLQTTQVQKYLNTDPLNSKIYFEFLFMTGLLKSPETISSCIKLFVRIILYYK